MAWDWLDHDQVLRPLHDRPDYQQVVRNIEARLAGQASRVSELRDAKI